jgi:hypothetical protein
MMMAVSDTNFIKQKNTFSFALSKTNNFVQFTCHAMNQKFSHAVVA